ncbi:MAG TPA: ABC transporter permease subunit, partial [Phycicoccus sp.]|nr:ABC transporter permease subunit [Phycicoccus sp.]
MSTVTADPPTKKRLSPRKRAQRMRWAQYLVLAIVTVVAISVADWGQIQSVFFRGDMIKETFAQGLPTAFKNTIVYTLGAFVLGLIWGTILALMRLSSVAPYRWLASTYIEFFRGLPAIVVFIAFGLLPLAFPGLVIPFDPYGTVWIALGLVGAAYMAETIRAGIQVIYQDFSLFPNLSVAENIALNEELADGKRVVNWRQVKSVAADAL